MSHSMPSRARVDRRMRRGLAAAALAVITVLATGAAQAATVQVTSAADAGPDTFRAAVAAANANAAVDTIEFDGALAVTLTSAVVYTSDDTSLVITGVSATLIATPIDP